MFNMVNVSVEAVNALITKKCHLINDSTVEDKEVSQQKEEVV